MTSSAFLRRALYDADVAVVRLHDDVARSEMDLVGAELSLDTQVVAVDAAPIRDFQRRQQRFDDFFPRRRALTEIAKRCLAPVHIGDIAPPLVRMLSVRARIDPVRIVGDARHAGEEIAVAHDLGKDDLRHRLHANGVAAGRPERRCTDLGLTHDRVESHLVGRDVEVGLAVGDLGVVAARAPRPELRDDVPCRESPDASARRCGRRPRCGA